MKTEHILIGAIILITIAATLVVWHCWNTRLNTAISEHCVELHRPYPVAETQMFFQIKELRGQITDLRTWQREEQLRRLGIGNIALGPNAGKKRTTETGICDKCNQPFKVFATHYCLNGQRVWVGLDVDTNALKDETP